SPAFIADPGTEIADLVHVMDIYTTIADATDADGSDGSDSVSLMPFLRDVDGDIRDHLFTELFNPSTETGELAVRVDDWKLLVKVVDGGDGPCRGNYRLYDLSTDRFEGTNLSSTNSDVVATMTDWIDSVRDGEDAWFDVDDCD
ncbi:MAG: arylsulfatase A-like enzyme, partial [Myxococcota bacterium]